MIDLDDNIVKSLSKNISDANKNKSIYWKEKAKTIDTEKLYGGTWYGSYTKKTYKSYLRNTLQYFLYDKKIFKTSTFKKIKSYCNTINREIDFDILRHIFTFDYLIKYFNKKNLNINSICVIGDGKANSVLCSLKLFKNIKIYSVNLPEVLIADYKLIKKLKIVENKFIHAVDDINENIQDEKKLIMVPCNKKDYLKNKNIDLFMDMASMQEMTDDEIASYFKIINNNKSFFYCCNRKEKKLNNIETTRFYNYPWKSASIILDDYCEWHNKYVTIWPPFFNFRKNKLMHRFVSFN